MNKLVLFLSGVIALLFVGLFFVINYMYLPKVEENKANCMIVSGLRKEIGEFNEKQKIYIKKIEEFKAKTKNDESYSSWSSVVVPSDVLEFLQE